MAHKSTRKRLDGKKGALTGGLMHLRDYAMHQRCSNSQVQEWIRQGLPVDADRKINVKAADVWVQERRKKRTGRQELLDLKTQAEVDKLRAAKALADLELAKKRGELHAIKECSESLGQMLNGVNVELQSLPSRLQSAFPENKLLGIKATDMVNECVKRIHEFLEAHREHDADTA